MGLEDSDYQLSYKHKEKVISYFMQKQLRKLRLKCINELEGVEAKG